MINKERICAPFVVLKCKLGFILAFPLRGRGTAEAVDEGNAICTYERLSKLHIVY